MTLPRAIFEMGKDVKFQLSEDAKLFVTNVASVGEMRQRDSFRIVGYLRKFPVSMAGSFVLGQGILMSEGRCAIINITDEISTFLMFCCNVNC